jgi:hypothetical protein
MIKVLKSVGGLQIKDPENLIPIVYRCFNCQCTIRKIEETNSYVIMSISKQVAEGELEACSFCKRLIEAQGITY